MKLLDLFTDFHNWVSDKDFIWWPFSFLRPEKHVPMSMMLILQMAACFSGHGTLMFTAFALVNNMFSASSMFQTLALSFVLFLSWFTLVTRTFWNRRAHKLSTGRPQIISTVVAQVFQFEMISGRIAVFRRGVH